MVAVEKTSTILILILLQVVPLEDSGVIFLSLVFQIFTVWEVFFICLLIVQKVKCPDTRVGWPGFKTWLQQVPAMVRLGYQPSLC